MEIEVGQRYRHYKNGKLYTILAIGHHTEIDQRMVVYQAEYDDPEFGNRAVWVRPYDMFVEKVDWNGKVVPRFQQIEQ